MSAKPRSVKYTFEEMALFVSGRTICAIHPAPNCDEGVELVLDGGNLLEVGYSSLGGSTRINGVEVEL